jgi:hypothetical protein
MRVQHSQIAAASVLAWQLGLPRCVCDSRSNTVHSLIHRHVLQLPRSQHACIVCEEARLRYTLYG